MNRARSAACALLLAAGYPLSPVSLGAGESNGTPAAKAFFAEGEAAAKAGKLPDAAAAFRRAIDADPDFVDAHQRFIEISRRQESPGSRTPDAPRLRQLYEGWARQYPKRAVYQWALGFLSHEANTADTFFKKAIAIDAAFARAYSLLAKNADQRGDWAAQRQFLKMAADGNPDDPRYLLQYGFAQRKSDPPQFRTLALQVVDKFPTSQQAAQALYYLAGASTNPERRGYYDRLRANYPIDTYGYSMSAMYELYGDLTEPSEALPLAQEMSKALPTSKTWQQRMLAQEAMARAKTLLAEKEFAAALDLLEKTQRPSGGHGTTWTLLEAEAATGAGNNDQAYATLVEGAAALPDPRLEAALTRHGANTGKARTDVEADVWKARDSKAKVAAAFELPSSRGGTPVKLSDYRGRVVLLAFWFPG